MRYRFSTDLVVRTKPSGGVALIALANGAYVEGDAWLAELVGKLHRKQGFTRGEFTKALSAFVSGAEAEQIFLHLAAIRLLEAQSVRRLSESLPQYPWGEMGWSAAELYHGSTAYTEFIQGDAEGSRIQALGSSHIGTGLPGPPMCKAYPTAPRTPLGPSGVLMRNDIGEILLRRRTMRSFSPDTIISREALSTLLHYAARQQGTLYNKYFGEQMLRTSPSGGARHPVEIYPQILRSIELPLGSSYYDPTDHSLRRLADASDDLIFRIGQRQPGCSGMAVAFLITARFSRNLWKYRYAKSFSFTLLDVGHFVQTLLLCCEAMGLRAFLTPAVNVLEAQKHLRLENIYDECCVYLVTAG